MKKKSEEMLAKPQKEGGSHKMLNNFKKNLHSQRNYFTAVLLISSHNNIIVMQNEVTLKYFFLYLKWIQELQKMVTLI